MTRIEYIKKSRKIADNSLITFLSALNNTVFTTRFFRGIANQTFEVEKIVTIPESQFLDYAQKENLSHLNVQTLYIGRKRNGTLVGSIFIDKNGKALLSYKNINMQIPIIHKESKIFYKELTEK
jgi:hypothetical protein